MGDSRRPVIMNVLFDHRLGGPQLRVGAVAAGLKDSFKTVVVMPKGDGLAARVIRENGIEVQEISLGRIRDTLNFRIHWQWAWEFIGDIRRLCNIINKEGVQIVHTNGLMNVQAAFAARVTGSKLVWHLNDVTTPGVLRILFMPLLLLLSQRIVAASEAVGKKYFRLLPKVVRPHYQVIHAPVDFDRFNEKTRAVSACDISFEKEDVVIGTIGNLNPVKGHESFIRAAAMIKKNLRRSKFIIVGTSLENRQNYYKKLMRLQLDLGLRDSLYFLGYRKDIPFLINRFNIYVHSSLEEACPMAVLEAMAAGKPIVATRVGGVPDLIKHGESGILVNKNDPDALAKAVIRLAIESEYAKEIGQKARETAAAYFDVKHCVRKHADLYSQILSS